MTEIREHTLTKDCWCEPEVYGVNLVHRYQLPELLDCVGEGWHRLLTDLHERLIEIDPKYDCSQLKEKFGGLRVYLARYNEECETEIRIAEEQAYKTCEFCGGTDNVDTAPPVDRPHGWIKTLCEWCHTERG